MTDSRRYGWPNRCMLIFKMEGRDGLLYEFAPQLIAQADRNSLAALVQAEVGMTLPQFLTAYYEAMREQGLGPRGAEWQPIETAPKDGTSILVYTEYFLRSNPKADRVFISAWDPSICRDGWGSIHSCCGSYQDLKPTHWQPLTEPQK